MPLKENLGRPAPKWYRKFANGYIIFVVPGLSAIAQGWGLIPVTLNRVTLLLSFSASVAKLIEWLSSNGEVYARADTKTEEVNVVKTTTTVDSTKPENN